MRIGIFGGTFDPIHLGHLLIAEEVRLHLALEEVVFIPTGQPWMKAEQPLSSPEDRLNMVRLAVSCNPFFWASPMEVERPGPTYTVDTLNALWEDVEPDSGVYFIIGMDSLRTFHRWKEPGQVLDMCTLAVVARPGCEEYALSSLDSVADGGASRAVLVPTPLVDLSGTRIRSRAAKGESIRYQVPSPVERYIWQHHLYRNQGEDE